MVAGYLEDCRANAQRSIEVLDPMGGVGTLARYVNADIRVWTNDIEEEWASQAPFDRWTTNDARHFPSWWVRFFDAIATSCTYGNRMADHHEARDDSKRHTYRHYLGRPLTEGNTGMMAWGPEYRETHEAIWAECRRVLCPGGVLVLNVSDHMKTLKKGQSPTRQAVSAWHVLALTKLGFRLTDLTLVPTKRQRHGANGAVRVEHECVFLFEKVGL